MAPIELQGNERIVLLEYHRIGDALMALPILTAIKQKFPNTYTVAVLDRVATGIADNNPYIDKVVYLDRKAPVDKHIGLLRKLRREKFDITIDSLGMGKTAMAGVLLGAKIRLGLQPKRKYLYTHLFRKEKKSCYSAQKRLGILKLTNAHPGQMIYPQIWLKRTEQEALKQEHLTMPWNTPFISSAPGSKIAGRQYSADDWAALYNHLLTAYSYNIILFGSPAEKEFVEDIHQKVRDKERCRIIPLKNAKEVATVISLADYHICRDNGTKHIANALMVDTFTLWDGRAPARGWISDNPSIIDYNHESPFEPNNYIRQKKLIEAVNSFLFNQIQEKKEDTDHSVIPSKQFSQPSTLRNLYKS